MTLFGKIGGYSFFCGRKESPLFFTARIVRRKYAFAPFASMPVYEIGFPTFDQRAAERKDGRVRTE
ncbi:MAG: hypothetical protein ACLRTQ_11280 [Candidatus Borkfalkia sp.]